MTQGTLKKVVRTYQEVDVSPVSPSSTTGCEEKRLANIHSVNVG